MTPKVVKKIEFQRPDQVIKVVRCADRHFFVYNHRGLYHAIFTDVDDIGGFVERQSYINTANGERKRPLFVANLRDYDMYEDHEKQDEMWKDILNYIESDCRKSMNGGGM